MIRQIEGNRRAAGAAWALGAALTITGCEGWEAHLGEEIGQVGGGDHTPVSCDPKRDQAAILRMAGSFDVTFAFEEVEPLREGYELREPYRTSGTEVVAVLADAAEHVSLQHVLLIEVEPGSYYPLKHWRQDWTFEDEELLEFRGDRVWSQRELSPPEARCTWSQAVYQVDDGPRYESYGRFHHERGASTWTSDRTYRPLPRRESQRSDYDVLLAVNRHIITDAGWTHDEDNLKWVLASSSALVREHGINTYRRIDLPEADVALDYLVLTGPFWEDARDEWELLLSSAASLRVEESRDGTALFDLLLPMAEELAEAEPDERRRAIRAAIAPYVQPLP